MKKTYTLTIENDQLPLEALEEQVALPLVQWYSCLLYTSIFSIIVEDTGLIGGTCVVLLYLFLLARAAMIARRCRRTLPTLIVIGTASMITLQAFFHMAINTGVFPVSGQPLPLISKGGTSIIIINFAFAILLSISRTVAGLTDKQNANQEDQDLPENLRAENPSLLINYTNVWK